MVNEHRTSPFLDQIVADTLANISERDEFDASTLKRLEQLMKSQEIVIWERVVEALCTDGEQ